MPMRLLPTYEGRGTELSSDLSISPGGVGQITQGIDRGTLVDSTLEFVKSELPQWRDRPDRQSEQAEEALNAQLCKHLNARAQHVFPMVQFHHEQKQSGRRRVDMSAGLCEGAFIGSTYHSIDDPFLVVEGKRLPPPPDPRREREYVTGGTEISGGIQRFKLRLHGAGMDVAVIVGYIQSGTCEQWHARINTWIRKLASTDSVDTQAWGLSELLDQLSEGKSHRTASCRSFHPRAGRPAIPPICIHHLWVEMSNRD